MKTQAAVLSLIVGLGVVAHQGCGGIHENPGSMDNSSGSAANLAASDGAGLAAFESGFYAFTKTQNCVKCHGVFQSPKFADPDPAVAYSFFKTLVNPTTPTTSIIITYAGNSHCADTPCSDPTVRPQVTSLLSSWAAAELASGGGGGGGSASIKYYTGSLPMPATLPLLGAAPAVLRFPLASLAIPALSGAVLEVELNRFNAAGNYRVARPKIQGNNAIVTVTGIHVFLRPSTTTGYGLEDQNQGLAWTSVSAIVNASTLPATLPTTPLTALPMSATALSILPQSTADVITIGFDDIQNGAVAAPAVVHFSDLVSANQQLGIFTQSCVACHSTANPSGTLDITNYTQAKALAATIQTRINSTASPMPPAGLLPTASRQVINTWVTGGGLQ